MKLAKQQVILDHAKDSFVVGWEAFEEQIDETGIFRTWMMRRGDWLDFGEPKVITVTIEPGDLLNDESA